MSIDFRTSSSHVGDGFLALMKKMSSGSRLRPRADVTAYRDFVLRHEATVIDEVVPAERRKCNRKAAELRQEGNRLYLAKQFDQAVAKYNESLCWAEEGTEHVGMVFANRSTIYYEKGEYEYALANVALARGHNYPEKFLAKLAERERKCRDMLAGGHSKGTVLYQSLELNVTPNEKVRFVADGIGMKVFEGFGRGLVAKKEFLPGDIILDEKPFLKLVSTSYHYCSNCAGYFHGSLIPCPGCVSTMYCSEECLRKDYRYFHRFECGLWDRLRHVQYVTTLMGPKRFFYGLTAFGDDLQAMMDYCETATDDDPFTVDHTKEDAILEQFKVLHQAKVNQPMPELESIIRMAAAASYVVFMKNPTLKRLVKTKPQKDFIVRTFLDYIRKNTALSLDVFEFVGCTNISTISTISSLANHSHDPNALFVLRYGTLRFWVIRPIHPGDQITISYGPTWWEPQPSYSSIYTCCCPVCDEASDWCVREGTLPRNALNLLNARTPQGRTFEETDAKMLRQLHELFTRYGHCHPEGSLGPKLQLCKHLIAGLIHRGSWTLERAQVAKAVAV